MASRRNESKLDVVQSGHAGPSVLIPYPGSTLSSSPIAVAIAAKPADADDEAEDELAEGSDDDGDSDGDDSDSDADARAAAASRFLQPLTPSAQLALIVGAKPITRVEAVKRLWQYIKEHKLQKPKDPRTIHLDAALKGVFGDVATVNMFEMTKFLLAHLS